MAKQVTKTYNDLNDLKFVKKSFIDEKTNQTVEYYEYRLYYTEKNYIRLTFGEKQVQDKNILKELVKNGVIQEVK